MCDSAYGQGDALPTFCAVTADSAPFCPADPRATVDASKGSAEVTVMVYRLGTGPGRGVSATGQPECPPWCATRHGVCETDAVFHHGLPARIRTEDGPLADEVLVAAERLDLLGEPGDATVYVEGAAQSALSPAQAVRLARALLDAAVAASGGAVAFTLLERTGGDHAAPSR
ncbi:DUF6907 domain-containing protein [Rhizomonospora bruguierae]|uniref:DUF6907 domain-containing protein n=1 Tax=Rhizomonospora bruguierae TaxID=1581705 RepID=UPI001BCDD86B|nr:hypothetical protein [Micromonospora sp. NBRC 107566]